MGAVGGGQIDTESVSPEGSAVVADALHSVSTVESLSPKQALVSDSFRGRGPSGTEVEMT